MDTEESHAIVVGAGMAGLLTTLALVGAGCRVTLVDRDPIEPDDALRPGTPQAPHVHALLPGGIAALEHLAPGFTDELAVAGATVGDVLEDNLLCFNGHELRRGISGLPLVQASRALMEGVVRRRVLQASQVTVLGRCDVTGLLVRDGSVQGVRLLRRADHSAEEERSADVVVDATGRTCRSAGWLRGAGLEAPEVERVRVDVHYATRLFRRPARGARGVLHAPTPWQPRGGAVSLIEGMRMLVTLAGVCGERPPGDPAGFDAYAESLRPTYLTDAMAHAEALGDPTTFSFPAAARRRTTGGPAGLLVVGDALCSLNPVYGQGISVAALQALALSRHLRHHALRDTRRVQRVAARVVDVPWQMAAGADLAFPAVDGRRTRSGQAMGRYVARVHSAASRDVHVGRAFLRVTGLVAPAPLLLRPDVVARVALSGRPRVGASG